jgi:hypothetical protein
MQFYYRVEVGHHVREDFGVPLHHHRHVKCEAPGPRQDVLYLMLRFVV